MDPLAIFLITGQICTIGFKGSLSVKRSPPSLEIDLFRLSEGGQSALNLFFIVSGFCHFFIVVYGFFHLDWWIPVVATVIGFPFTHHLFIRPIISDIFSMIIGTALSLPSAAFVAWVWFF